jgi:hypothetical protein
MIQIVGIFVAARDGQDAGAQDVGKRVNNPRGVRLGKRLASAPKSLRQFRRSRYIRQRIPALQ